MATVTKKKMSKKALAQQAWEHEAALISASLSQFCNRISTRKRRAKAITVDADGTVKVHFNCSVNKLVRSKNDKWMSPWYSIVDALTAKNLKLPTQSTKGWKNHIWTSNKFTIDEICNRVVVINCEAKSFKPAQLAYVFKNPFTKRYCTQLITDDMGSIIKFDYSASNMIMTYSKQWVVNNVIQIVK